MCSCPPMPPNDSIIGIVCVVSEPKPYFVEIWKLNLKQHPLIQCPYFAMFRRLRSWNETLLKPPKNGRDLKCGWCTGIQWEYKTVAALVVAPSNGLIVVRRFIIEIFLRTTVAAATNALVLRDRTIFGMTILLLLLKRGCLKAFMMFFFFVRKIVSCISPT